MTAFRDYTGDEHMIRASAIYKSNGRTPR